VVGEDGAFLKDVLGGLLPELLLQILVRDALARVEETLAFY